MRLETVVQFNDVIACRINKFHERLFFIYALLTNPTI